MSLLVQFENIARDFNGNSVFRDISFEISTAEHLALLGPSGCGKSTLLRLLAGLDPPSQGRILINGKIVSEDGKILVPAHERQMAMVFQDLALWPNLTALQNVLLGMGRMNLGRRERRTAAMAALEICRMESFANRKPASLSAGQQQRVALARALAVRPKLLALDEPFSGLDLTLKTEILEEIRRLAKELDLTVLLVSHDALEAVALCTEAFVLENGRCKEKGSFDLLLQNPASTTLRTFLQNIPDAHRFIP